MKRTKSAVSLHEKMLTVVKHVAGKPTRDESYGTGNDEEMDELIYDARAVLTKKWDSKNSACKRR